jgi:hypothetical protein
MAHRIPLAVAASIVAAACTIGQAARAEPPPPPTIAPPAPEHPGHVDPMLVLTGAVFMGIPYGASVAAGAVSNIPADKFLYIPVAGPAVDLIVRNTCATEGCKGDVGTVALPLALSALAQAGGLAMLITAFTSPGQPPASAFAKAEPPRPHVRVVPSAYAGGAGLTAFGTF